MLLKNKGTLVLLTTFLSLGLAACEGDDGNDGAQGPQGPAGTDGMDGADGSDGADGASAIVVQTQLAVGDANCPNGGVRIDSGTDADGSGTLEANEITQTAYVCNAASAKVFQRVATFEACRQYEPVACDTDTQTLAEIVTATPDGRFLIYTDSEQQTLGIVDISDPANPLPDGIEALAGEPTSVAVGNNYVVAGVNTSPDFVNPSGELAIFDLLNDAAPPVTVDLAGQPDSVAISPDGRYAAIVIENERDEDLGNGEPPQAPAGTLQILDLSLDPADWQANLQTVDLTGLATLFPADPEPEYVDINSDNIAVVSLQENNYLILVDVTDGSIVNHFSAGDVDLAQVDILEEDEIDPSGSLTDVPREPDGVAWINNELFATADEGDLFGGSRGFTIFNTLGEVLFTSDNDLDHLAISHGHYPDGRSENKGNEPENVEFGSFDGDDYLFVNSERSSLTFVYNVNDPVAPVLTQVLPTALGPEGALAITSRNLLVVASEEDERGDKFRGGVNIYSYELGNPTYPSIISMDSGDGTPIPWSALSGLAYDAANPGMLYSIEDSAFISSRIFGIDVSKVPAELGTEIMIMDTNDVFLTNAPTDDVGDDADVFSSTDLAAMINADKSVNLDPEGIAIATGGGFWIASEGRGTVGDAGRPVEKLNFIFKVTDTGVIETVVPLEPSLNAVQLRFGLEGIAEYNGMAYVAFQRAWNGEANPRIGIYDVANDTWSYVFYPLEAPTSPAGGWVGLSDITSLGNGEFLIVERDNQGGPDARIKRLYKVDIGSAAPDSTLTKELVVDLFEPFQATGGLMVEKIEGSAIDESGRVWLVNDNDGVDDNSGETRLVTVGPIN